LSLQLIGTDLHSLRQALAHGLDGARSEAATGIFGAAAALDYFYRFAGLDLSNKPKRCLFA